MIRWPGIFWHSTLLLYCLVFLLIPACRDRSDTPPQSILSTFAVIGDYGLDGPANRAVSDLVKSWNPDFIITTGDNNYYYGEQATIDANIGKYYHQFIHPYSGTYGEGSVENRFFPSLGNHDWLSPSGAQPFFEYFVLPGNERYYTFTWGPIQFFILNTDANEPDGVAIDSIQANWLKNQLSSSGKAFKMVYFHHPPFSSGLHGSHAFMQWPFKEWGADCVFSGHDHTYERILVNDFPYFVNGLGGSSIYDFTSIVSGSQSRYNRNYGAMLVVVGERTATFKFMTIDREIVDEYSLTK